MAKKSAEEKAANKRAVMIDVARQYSTRTYAVKVVSPIFQRMVRAEWGAQRVTTVQVMVDGDYRTVGRSVGECVCVTCGKVLPWDSGIKGMHTGHFIAGRGNSVLFDEDNVAPQCSRCNVYLSGNPQEYRKWMIEAAGVEVIERLERQRHESRKFTHEELVDMRIEYDKRLRAAIESMSQKQKEE